MVGKYVDVAVPNKAGQRVAVFALMFFVFFYGLFVDAASFIYSAEIYPTQIRARGVALATSTYFIACITYVTPGATAIATIGWRYFLVFIGLTVITVTVIFFFYPETKGRSLEELAELFGEPVAVHLTAAAGATEEEKRELDMEIKTEEIRLEHVHEKA
jgi:predicted MFS family arabinose efflux permease